MKGEFTAIIETASEGGFWAIFPEVPGANGQGETIEEAKQSLKEAIQLIFEDRVADASAVCPKMPFRPSSRSNEATRARKETSSCRLLFEARGWIALAVDQPTDRSG